MKKIFALTAILALICVMASCGDKKDDNSQSESSVPEIPAASESSETTVENTDTAKTAETVSAKSEALASTEKSSVTTTASDVENSDSSAFCESEEGGIVFEAPAENVEDSALIAAAQQLFEQACETEWNFTVGSPYEVDHNVSAKNSYGWDCYLVTADGINSLADVRRDYHKVFSEDYKDNLDEVFVESDGRVYCLCGERGSDIFYIDSRITAVNSRSDSEISFTVTDSYSDDDLGGGRCTKERDFAISLDSDGAWRVSRFILPY